MDAEFVEFLDKKFQGVSGEITGVRTDLERKIAGVQNTFLFELREVEDRLGERITRLEEAVGGLMNSIDRLLKLYEDVRVEQAAIIADLNRIKAVLKEKLGVEL